MTIPATDTRLRYFGKLRPAAHCGKLHGREIYLLGDEPKQALVRLSRGTTDQASPLFLTDAQPDFDQIVAIEWSPSEAAAKAKLWIRDLCTERAAKLSALASSLHSSAEGSPV